MAATSTAPPPDDDLVEIELEPTHAPDSQPAGAAVAPVGAGLPSIGRESEALLRDRLKAAAIALALLYALLTLWNLYIRETGLWVIPLTMALRVIAALAAFGLLASRVPLALPALRGVELALFGLTTLLMMAGQYFGNLEYIRRGDVLSLLHLVAYQKNGVLQTSVLMLLYGTLIPNDPRRAARMVLTMALGPLVVLSILLELHEEAAHLRDVLAARNLSGSNALFLAISAGLAIYIAHILNRLRATVREARQLGQYRLIRKLGSGGMGDVYLAEHQLLKRPCALKLIRPDVGANPVALARFEREVQAAAQLGHPSTIEIYDYGHTDDGTFYYVMQYLPGLNLAQLVEQFGPLPPGRAIYLIRQVCGALNEAHRRGLVHRDLKPPNIFVAILGGRCDVAKVLDFGLVKLTADPSAPQLTADYTVSGTPAYMAPEQAKASQDVDGRADIYALGAILYFALTGRPPFEGTSPMDLMIAHARDPVLPPSHLNPAIPPDLEAVILRCLAKDPADRYPTARALEEALAACGSAETWGSNRAETWWRTSAELVGMEATP